MTCATAASTSLFLLAIKVRCATPRMWASGEVSDLRDAPAVFSCACQAYGSTSLSNESLRGASLVR